MRSNVSFRYSCVPVHRYARWERQTLHPIVTGETLKIQTPSPIQTSSPIESRHGKLIFTSERITTDLPIFATNPTTDLVFNADGNVKGVIKNRARSKTQSASFHFG